MYLAAQGGAQQLSAFQRVGISQKELQTGTIPLDQALGRIAGRLASLPDGWQKSAEAQALFGKTGDRMLPFLNQGPEGLARISAEAERLHLVMSTKTALAAEQLNDALKRLRGTAE